MPIGRNLAFVPETYVWDVATVFEPTFSPQALQELLVRLFQNVNDITTILNIKTTGIYSTDEFITSALYFPVDQPGASFSTYSRWRPVRCKVIVVGQLNAGTTQVFHGIEVTPRTHFVQIYGTTEIPGVSSLPLPFVAATAVADNIELRVDNTYVYVISGGTDRSAYTQTEVVLWYLQ